MKFILILLLLFAASSAFGQDTLRKPLVSAVTVNRDFKDTLTFTKKWDYPWYIVTDDDGNMENTLGGTLTGADTAHLFHTASCVTNHQGEHYVRYCEATLVNDTINLVFQAALPAYASLLSVGIRDKMFWTAFTASYPAPAGKLEWTITNQKLVLDKDFYVPGDILKGYVEVEFVETKAGLDPKKTGRKYYFKGYLKTPLH